ncbi:SRPBCC family protein [Ktedonosporobacter rubrisoli]|uniref:SRPBCC family protein n=1 Tax=Ktedonosporobacter rubrisoli TaxID=2509675 RepID=A0A4P6JY78_KTERU|nr:SRPBCC family protein [Ktedonosporobacter rubrisoli]QBD80758.1 SRPBCC family protein [Ktedonosporobacter rubrisoli]
MARAYYSTVFEQPAEQIWSIVRDFGNYAIWGEGCGESHIEEGKTGESVGAVRNIRNEKSVIRQRLLAQSDRERTQTYEFCEPLPFPIRNYEASIRVTPITDSKRAFVEWWASFDCEPGEYEHWTTFFSTSFAGWLEALRQRVSQ